jgi:heme-degrading monooxygenase HmoA
MHARTGTLEVDPDKVDAASQSIQSKVESEFRDQQGYKGFVILADRGSGKVIGISFWDSEADLKASDELGARARSAAAESADSSSEPVREVFEVLFDDQV